MYRGRNCPRARGLALGCLAICCLLNAFSLGQQVPSPAGEPAQARTDATLEGVPENFSPLNPITDLQRHQINVYKLYATARALEDQERIKEALALLEQAKKEEDGSAPILSRLSRLFFASGKVNEAIEAGRQAMSIDPNDTQTLTLLFGLLLERKNDPLAAESFLRSVLSNPKLDSHGASDLLCRRALGDLYFEVLDKPEKAADAYTAVIEGLDARQASKLTQADRDRILRGGGADTYFRFGDSLLQTKRYDLAIRAFRNGLAYDPDHGQIPRVLAEALFKKGHPDEALTTLNAYLAKQPQGREAYDLLRQILEKLGRKEEYLKRLEEAAAKDRKNLSLQFLLADQLRDDGRVAEADTLLRELLQNQRDPQVYVALTAALIKSGKADEFLRVVDEALTQRGAFQVLAPQIEQVAQDKKLAGEVLSFGIKRLETNPAALREPTRRVLSYIAVKSGHPDEFVKLGRLVLDQDPSVANFKEYVEDLRRVGRHAQAAQAIDDLIQKYPNERNAMMLGAQSQSLYLSGQIDQALTASKEAVKLEPDDRRTQFFVGFLLGRLGKNDEAVEHYQKILAKFPNDAEVERQARSGLSVIYVNQDQLDKGEHELEILLEKTPDEPGINNDLGYLYADQGKNLEKAETMIRIAVEDEPENPSYLDSLGWVLFKRGKLEMAAEQLEKAAKDNPNLDATILDHLGDVYFQLKRYTEARDNWTKAQELASRSNPPDKRLSQLGRKLVEIRALMETQEPTKSPSP